MHTVGVNRGHNSSTTLLKDGDIQFHLENERLSNIKYDWYAFNSLSEIKKYTNKVDHIAIAGLTNTIKADVFSENDLYTTFIINQHKSFSKNKVIINDYGLQHHKTHAACAFYNSGFDRAICIIKDGMGSDYAIEHENFSSGSYGRENGSSFLAEYPDKFTLIENHIIFPSPNTNTNLRLKLNNITTVSNNLSEAYAFNTVSKFFGYHGLDAGKVMGMSSYGYDDDNIPSIYKNNFINFDLFKVGTHLSNIFINTKEYDYLNTEDFQIRSNFAYKLQRETEKNITEYILKLVQKTGCKNVCLSGGYFLNCVANYYIIKNLPEDINIYVEPISSDAGTSLGASKLMWHTLTEDTTVRKLNSLYLGPQQEYNLNYIKQILTTNEFIDENVKADEIANLICNRNIVSIFQGRSESGPRSLGNRSILYDPRDPNGRDYLNLIKGREWFRPFAGTVLYEYRNDWFDLSRLDESPFMMYAVNVLRDNVPAITHVDNTCRVQTLKRYQNENYYNLIECFYKQTGIPILLNTSLNLSGDCIAETIYDGLNIIRNSKIKYLYLPEYECLISNDNGD
jgi:carbamoyltransferase